MKKTLFRITVLIAILAMTASVAYAAGGNPFAGVKSTEDGYSTWDSDLINVEAISQTGKGVYVAVLDTGLVPNWRDYFPQERVAINLGTGFEQQVTFKAKTDNGCEFDVYHDQLRQSTWVGSNGSTHGTHVASTIIGYFYRSNSDLAAGFPLPPIIVRGIAPDVTIIPVKVLADYTVPAMPKCAKPTPSQKAVFGTDEMVAAGINYATDLAIAGYKPMVINMSLGGPELADVEKAAIDRAIENGVIVVAAAGNAGEEGMDFPGAYPPVISAGSVGWIGEWLKPGAEPLPANRYRMWWLQYSGGNMLPGSGEVADPTMVEDIYLSDFSSRALAGQDLDVLAPGSWVRGPFPSSPGFSHLPWWSKGIGDLRSGIGSNFFYVGGTSMATPHVASAAALLLEKDPTLMQDDIASILKSTALALPDTGSRDILDNTVPATITWDTDCDGVVCDPVGAGVIQLDEALK